jgi:hypothetical protein
MSADSTTRLYESNKREGHAGEPRSYVDIADELDEIPWDVLAACNRLVRGDLLVEGVRKNRGIFTLKEGCRFAEQQRPCGEDF